MVIALRMQRSVDEKVGHVLFQSFVLVFGFFFKHGHTDYQVGLHDRLNLIVKCQNVGGVILTPICFIALPALFFLNKTNSNLGIVFQGSADPALNFSSGRKLRKMCKILDGKAQNMGFTHVGILSSRLFGRPQQYEQQEDAEPRRPK